MKIMVMAKENPVVLKIGIVCLIISILTNVGFALFGSGVLSGVGASVGPLGLIGIAFIAVATTVFQTVIMTFVACMFWFVGVPLLATFTK